MRNRRPKLPKLPVTPGDAGLVLGVLTVTALRHSLTAVAWYMERNNGQKPAVILRAVVAGLPSFSDTNDWAEALNAVVSEAVDDAGLDMGAE